MMDKMRSRAESDVPGSRARAGRCTFEVLHTDVLLGGLGSRKAVSELLPDLLKNPVEQRHWRLIHSRYALDTQNRQYALVQKVMMLSKLWCEPRWRFWIRRECLGARCGRMGTCVRNCVDRCSQINSDAEYGTDFS